MKKAYARAGVDVDLGNRLKREIQARSLGERTVRRCSGRSAGSGDYFAPNFPGMREPVLVASVDGVGTKLKIAFAIEQTRHGRRGSRESLRKRHRCAWRAPAVLSRLHRLRKTGAVACSSNCFAAFPTHVERLVARCMGGETAQMPGMYRRGEYDLAGCIVGVVDRRRIIDGSDIKPGDVVLGLASTGLHTNGYSLARKILFDKMRLKVTSALPGSRITVGEELLRVHKNYQPLLAKIPRQRDQRARPYHRRWFDRQSAANFASKL